MPYKSYRTAAALFRRHRQLQDIRELRKVIYVTVMTLNMVYRPRGRADVTTENE